MAKTIKITFYSPKALWRMFWNWAFWPRRKKCAEWCDYYHSNLLCLLSDIVDKYEKNGEISSDTAIDLASDIEQASKKTSKAIAELMSKPME